MEKQIKTRPAERSLLRQGWGSQEELWGFCNLYKCQNTEWEKMYILKKILQTSIQFTIGVENTDQL